MKIITISREYGAGGHSVAKKVAKELGIEIYDRDIIRNTAKESGMEAGLIEEEEEIITRGQSFIRAITPISYDPQVVIEGTQEKVILDLAAKGPCVILGRCSDFILKNAGIESLNVFIHADSIHRAARVSELIGSTDPSEIKKVMSKKDRARRSYYEHYTGMRWGDFRNYEITLDSGALGYDLCARIICESAREAD